MIPTRFNEEFFVVPPTIEAFERYEEHLSILMPSYEFRFTLPIHSPTDEIICRKIYKMLNDFNRSSGRDGATLHSYLKKNQCCNCLGVIRDIWGLRTFQVMVTIRDIANFAMQFEQFLYSIGDYMPEVKSILSVNPNSGENLLALLEGGVTEC